MLNSHDKKRCRIYFEIILSQKLLANVINNNRNCKLIKCEILKYKTNTIFL